MHGARIRRQKEYAIIQEARQYRQRKFARENLQACACLVIHLLDATLNDFFIHRAAQKCHAVTALKQLVRAGRKVRIKPTLCQPARADIERYNFLPAEILSENFFCLVLSRVTYPHFQAVVVNLFHAASPQNFKVRPDLMLSAGKIFGLEAAQLMTRYRRIRQNLIEKERKKRLGVADNFFPAARRRQKRSPLVAMKIYHQVELCRAQ